MTDDHTFFQHGDEPDAANFASAFGISVVGGYLVRGFELTPHLDTFELDVAEGTAAVFRGEYNTSSDDIDPQETRQWTAYPVDKEDETWLEMYEDTVNHVYLDANRTTRDSPGFIIEEEPGLPTEASLKIGEVDTSAENEEDAVSDQWNLIRPDGTLTYPDEDAADSAAADLPAGTTVYDRENETYWRVE